MPATANPTDNPEPPMTTPTPAPRREYVLKAPIKQAGIERLPGSTVSLREDQAQRLAEQGIVDIEAPAKFVRAGKQEG